VGCGSKTDKVLNREKEQRAAFYGFFMLVIQIPPEDS
jgi:hypothetical protein